MSRKSGLLSAMAALAVVWIPIPAFSASTVVLVKGAQLFGEPLNAEHAVFRLNDTYVIWLLADRNGDLFEVDVGPKSYYADEFPSAGRPSAEEFLSEAEYKQTIKQISGLKDVGKLLESHGPPVPSIVGPLDTDRFERAFVHRIGQVDSPETVRKFSVYFLQKMAGSPEQIAATQSQSMVCLGSLWYYVPSRESGRVRLGQWQTLQVAGPSLRRKAGCLRTTVARDADGFTIEQPQNELIIVSPPYTVTTFAGRVLLGGSPIEAANVELLRTGTKKVLGTRTDSSGTFRISRVPEGRYKFKVTKDGF